MPFTDLYIILTYINYMYIYTLLFHYSSITVFISMFLDIATSEEYAISIRCVTVCIYV